MKHAMMTAALAAGLTLTGCATNGYGDPYSSGQSTQAQRAVTGGAIGAAAGAGLGAVIGGVSPVEGAIAGGIAGAVIGAVINNKQYYRDTRGYCYYVDQYGRPIYDYNVRC
jgi:outer membrane lipoprotein SlyB